MKSILSLYQTLLEEHGIQGWWPIINNKTLLCEYNGNAPRNDDELFEIMVGAILTQGTSWYPGVVRILQQLKLGRPFKDKELAFIKHAEMLKATPFEIPKGDFRKEKIVIKVTSLRPASLQRMRRSTLARLIRSSG